MKLKFKSPFSVAIAMGFGLIVLFGYFFGSNPDGSITLLGFIRDYLLKGAVVIAGMALIVGVGNLTAVHIQKVQKDETAFNSFFLVLALIASLGVGLYDIYRAYFMNTPGLPWSQWIYDYIQFPIATSLMAVLAITLTYAAARILRRRQNIFSAVFFGVVLLLFVGSIPQFSAKLPLLADIKSWIVGVPAVGGARGILLGVALGTIATGLRILMGVDRPYRG